MTAYKIHDVIYNRWEIHDVFAGGMGYVLKVYDRKLMEINAAKTFKDTLIESRPGMIERFQQEALNWINLDRNINIVQAYFFEYINERPFLFLEFIEGNDLSKYIQLGILHGRHEQIMDLAIQFCNGMKFANANGLLVHRDIKPQNVLISNDFTLKITDFGLSKSLDNPSEGPKPKSNAGLFKRLFGFNSKKDQSNMNGLTRYGYFLGTPAYASPEQFLDAKNLDCRSDIYSFGIMLYEMIKGEPPFNVNSFEEYYACHSSFAFPPIENSHLNKILQKCLAKNPQDRFESFEELSLALIHAYYTMTGKHYKCREPESNNVSIMLSNKGISLAKLGKYKEAISCLERSIASNHNDCIALSNMASVLSRMKEYDKALEYADKSLSINPQHVAALVNKGCIYNYMNKCDEALEYYNMALQNNQSCEEALLNIGIIEKERGNFTKALDYLTRAREVNPTNITSLFYIGVLHGELGNYEEELKYYNKVLHLHPRDVLSLMNLGIVLSILNRTDEAIKSFDAALQIDDQNADIWLNKGITIYKKLFDADNAIECIEKAHDLGHPMASDIFEQIMSDKKLSADDWSDRGVCCIQDKKSEEALECFERALSIDPFHSNAMINKGSVYFMKGMFDEAMDLYLKAKRLGNIRADNAIRKLKAYANNHP